MGAALIVLLVSIPSLIIYNIYYRNKMPKDMSGIISGMIFIFTFIFLVLLFSIAYLIAFTFDVFNSEVNSIVKIVEGVIGVAIVILNIRIFYAIRK